MGKKSRRVRKGQVRAAVVNEGRTQEECLTRKREAIQRLKNCLPGNDLVALNTGKTSGELPFSVEMWLNATEVQKIYRRAIECYEERTGFWASMDVKVHEARITYGNGPDTKDLDEYLCAVIGNQFFKMTHYVLDGGCHDGRFLDVDERAIRRWPRVKPHWRRFRRRICTRCPKYALLSEPRFLVCSGCGVARYCSESCQIADWPAHQGECRCYQLGGGPIETMGTERAANSRRMGLW